MRILFAASEVAGFAKTGGLADVAASLPAALARRGHECAVVMPLYRAVAAKKPEPTGHTFRIPIAGQAVHGAIWRTVLPDSDVPLYFVAQPHYFERDEPREGRTLYQYTTADGKAEDYPDNCERFAFFSRAVLEVMRLLDFWPDVVHVNDWHTGLTPVYLREVYARQADSTCRTLYRGIRTLFTIHNIAYQGLFRREHLPAIGLPWHLFNLHQLEYHGYLNFLKAGIVFADRITTVSPTYAQEIQTSAYGHGLQGVLSERHRHFTGIVNGVDYRAWDPATDRFLAANYGPENVQQGKAICKKTLQQKMGLPAEPHAPLIGMVSRLAVQKGLDLVKEAGAALLQQDAQLVILGDGDRFYRQMLESLRQRFPQKVALRFALDEELAHQIEAGADLFLMPSRYEPCGLNQLYSLKYGTVPIVRRTGGLADTVIDATPETVAAGTATGFVFGPPTAAALLEAIHRAMMCYHKEARQWLQIQQTGMRQDWSWGKSAAEYERLYEELSADAE